MLTNTDFADLLKSGSSNGLTSDGKSRFGLEQVKTWDKQNDAKGKKKPSSFGKTPARGGDVGDILKPDRYRDRADERRKDVVTTEEAALEAVVSRLDAEQTKFLGGDVEHTHLVKGLDYALLRKIRDQEKEQNEDENEATITNKLEKDLNKNEKKNLITSNKNVPIVKKVEGFKDFRTTSVIGETLKNMLLNPESSLNITRDANYMKNTKAVADAFSRMAFDFDLSEDGESDLPTIISRSKKEWTDGLDGESSVSCLLSIELGLKLSSIFGKNALINTRNEKQNLKRKRKEQILDEKQKISTENKIQPIGIIDDIFADVGKYVPVGALVGEDGEEEEEIIKKNVILEHVTEMDIVDINNDNNNNNAITEDANNTVKGLFKNLIPSFPSKIKLSEATGSTGLAVNDSPANVTKSNSKKNAACVFDDDDDDDEDVDEKRIFVKPSILNGRIKDKQTDNAENDDKGEGDLRRIRDDNNDLMAPIRALLAAQSAKEKAAFLRSEIKASSHNEGFKNESKLKSTAYSSLAVGADGKSRVHRDVFGVVGSSGSIGVRRGDAMAHGSYDDYGGDNETYDSDHEDENEGKDKASGGPKSAEEVENGKDYKGKEKQLKTKTSGGYENEKEKGKGKDDWSRKEIRSIERNSDSSGNWRHTSSNNSSHSTSTKDKDKDGGNSRTDTRSGIPEKQSAIRPRVENNRAARRAGKS